MVALKRSFFIAVLERAMGTIRSSVDEGTKQFIEEQHNRASVDRDRLLILQTRHGLQDFQSGVAM